MTYDLVVISLGAGLQSTVLAHMADPAWGLLPPVDAAIFADTQQEEPHTYQALWDLARLTGGRVPITVTSWGNLGEAIVRNAAGIYHGETPSVPFYTLNEDGTRGHLRRQCTWTVKIKAVEKVIRQMLGLRRGQWLTRYRVEQWLGYTTDEASRMKPAREKWSTLRYPLIEMDMSRDDCMRWLVDRGLPVPGKSACVFCPYHNDRMWARMKRERPESFRRAVAFERGAQKGIRGLRDAPYLHATRTPLDQVVFNESEQLDLFNNACEGACGT